MSNIYTASYHCRTNFMNALLSLISFRKDFCHELSLPLNRIWTKVYCGFNIPMHELKVAWSNCLRQLLEWTGKLLHAYEKLSDDNSSLSLFYESIPNVLLTEAFLYDLFPDNLSDPWFLRSILIYYYIILILFLGKLHRKTVIVWRVCWN